MKAIVSCDIVYHVEQGGSNILKSVDEILKYTTPWYF